MKTSKVLSQLLCLATSSEQIKFVAALSFSLIGSFGDMVILALIYYISGIPFVFENYFQYILVLLAIGLLSLVRLFSVSYFLRYCFDKEAEIAFRLFSSFSNHRAGCLSLDVGKSQSLILNESILVVSNFVIPFFNTVAAISSIGLIALFLLIKNPLVSLILGSLVSLFFVIIFFAVSQKLSDLGIKRECLITEKYSVTHRFLINKLFFTSFSKGKVCLDEFDSACRGYSAVQWLSQVIALMPRYLFEAVMIPLVGIGLVGIIFIGESSADLDVSTEWVIAALFSIFRLLPAAQSLFSSVSQIRYIFDSACKLGRYLEDIQKKSGVVREGIDVEIVAETGVIVNDVVLRYDDIELRYPSINLSEGRPVILRGPSGSGKSSLGYFIASQLPGDFCLEQPVKGYFSHKYLSLGKSLYVPSQFHLDGLTPRRLMKIMEIEENEKYVKEHIEILFRDLPSAERSRILDMDFGSLSTGQGHRIVLCLVGAADFDVLVFDEPTAALNPELERVTFDWIIRVFGDKRLVVITHSELSFGSLGREMQAVYI